MTCENCLYNHLCYPEDNIPCQEFEPADRYIRMEFYVGDTAYAIVAGGVCEVKIKTWHVSGFRDGSIGRSYKYDVTLFGETIERTWYAWGTHINEHRLFHTFVEAVKELCGGAE